jgi:hypothetical protein
MPAVRRGDVVLVIVQLARNGASWFDRALHRKVNLVATLRGRDVWYDAEPRARTNNGPGYSWVVYRLPCGPSWSQRTLRLWFEVDLPSDVQVEITAVLLHPWWDAHEGDLATLDDLT